jgi:hypothetical protein
MVKIYAHSLICLRGMVLNELSTGTNLLLTKLEMRGKILMKTHRTSNAMKLDLSHAERQMDGRTNGHSASCISANFRQESECPNHGRCFIPRPFYWFSTPTSSTLLGPVLYSEIDYYTLFCSAAPSDVLIHSVQSTCEYTDTAV